MSSSKNTKPSAKKDAKAKKPVAAKKAAPVAKPAAKKAPAAKKPAPATKAAPKAATKKAAPAAKKAVPAAKPAAKKAAPAKKVASAPKVDKKSAAKKVEAPKASKKVVPVAKVVKPASKAASKTAAKKAVPAAKPAAKKQTPAPKAAPAAKKAVPAAKPATKKPVDNAKPAVKSVKSTAVKAAPKATAKVEAAKAPAKKGMAAPEPVEVIDEVPAFQFVKNKPTKEEKKPVLATAILLMGRDGRVIKPIKTIMFTEVKEEDEKVNQKKVSSELKQLEKKPTASIRHKHSLAEETQEELTERILKELEEQNLAFTREAASQVCTRCNKNLVSPEFWVDKHLGYCEECAAILKLGQSKEARKVEYQMGAMGGDSLDEADEDGEFMSGPDAAALKEAEEELEDLDD